jgi:signal transduction histidine kinase
MLGSVSAAAVVTLLGVLGAVVVRSLRPLDDFAAQIAGIAETDLATRLPAAGVPVEMALVVDGFNGLLARLETAFNRERTFSSDVAHELRTPLAGLLATIQVALSRTRGTADYRDALARCEEISHAAHRLVETLLALARLEAGLVKPNQTTVEIDSLIRTEWDKVAAKSANRGVAVSHDDVAELVASLDQDQMRIVLANLLENAVEYTLPGGSIEISCHATTVGFAIRISNSPCELSRDKVVHVFDRFWRSDPARSNSAHAGLGLSLTKRIVELLGGAIDARIDDDRFVVQITIAVSPKGTGSCQPAVFGRRPESDSHSSPVTSGQEALAAPELCRQKRRAAT